MMPMDNRMMKGRLRPSRDLHRSLNEPSSGVRKKPIMGLRHQMSVMFRCWMPMPRSVGETKAVSAE